MAENICRGLCEAFPDQAETIKANLPDLLDRLEALEAYGEEALQNLSCRELVTFHDGFGYLAESFGLTVLEAVEEESGSEASAAQLIHLCQLVEQRQLPAIFTEVSGSVSAASVISRETGVPAYALDMAMSGESYFEAMYHNIDTLREALE
jgi:zinc transport system substrate-binding protein